MYRHGLGDCFLISFPSLAGRPFHVLIDCGLVAVATNPRRTMTRVATDIAAATGGHLDLVVVTHEHWDHVSGFSPHQARAVFDQKLTIDRVWYAWTEDKGSMLGQRLRREREVRARAMHRAAQSLHALKGSHAARAARISSLLTFVGIEDAATAPLAARNEGTLGKLREAFDYLAQRPGVTVEYLRPGDQPRAFPGVAGVRVYALGPPENEPLIKRSDPTKRGKEVYELAAGLSLDQTLLAAFSRVSGDDSDQPLQKRDCPFDPYLRREPADSPALRRLIATTWDRAGDEYRHIDNDWMGVAEALALALDKHTNNTSLVLAFEFVPSGRVMLFAADAQVGNWLSWQDLSWQVRDGDSPPRTITGPDLLRRTVLYKVGHHGSHNATMRDTGLEQMTSGDLVALVPVSKAQAMQNRWTQMPFDNLMRRLHERTRGRVVQSDPDVAAPSALTLAQLSATERRQFRDMLHADPDGLFYDLSMPM